MVFSPYELAIAAVAIIVAVLLTLYQRLVVTPRRQALAEALAARELANIVEETTSTTWGSFCSGMVVVTAIGCLVLFSVATTVFQQIEVAVIWIGATIMFGIGAALGQKRSYTIYRSIHRQ